MKLLVRVLLVCVVLVGAMVVGSSSAFQKRFALPAPPTKAEIERGRYLVEEVAKCSECHTPRKADGELDRAAWLGGAPIWVRPVAPIANWADSAPALAGLPGFTEAQVERVLEDGTRSNGEPLRPPMCIYHLSPPDARAIAAYLKALPEERHSLVRLGAQ
jgi:mono/diheme cytochrome c family protein